MFFVILLALSAAALAGAAEFFSIYGLSQIYAASAHSVIVMGITLGFAKLITTSFLYRHWKSINGVLKTYMLVAVAILMSITSIGAFGYLTAGYQKGNIPATEISQRLSNDKSELDRYINRKNQIDSEIAGISNNYVTAKKRLIASYKNEYDTLQPNIDRLTKEINDLQTKQINVEAKIGPIIYAARVLKLNPDNALFYLTILIVLVFDPLAVALTIATNIVIEKNKTIQQPSVQNIQNENNSKFNTKDTYLDKLRQEISDSNID